MIIVHRDGSLHSIPIDEKTRKQSSVLLRVSRSLAHHPNLLRRVSAATFNVLGLRAIERCCEEAAAAGCTQPCVGT